MNGHRKAARHHETISGCAVYEKWTRALLEYQDQPIPHRLMLAMMIFVVFVVGSKAGGAFCEQ